MKENQLRALAPRNAQKKFLKMKRVLFTRTNKLSCKQKKRKNSRNMNFLLTWMSQHRCNLLRLQFTYFIYGRTAATFRYITYGDGWAHCTATALRIIIIIIIVGPCAHSNGKSTRKIAINFFGEISLGFSLFTSFLGSLLLPVRACSAPGNATRQNRLSVCACAFYYFWKPLAERDIAAMHIIDHKVLSYRYHQLFVHEWECVQHFLHQIIWNRIPTVYGWTTERFVK